MTAENRPDSQSSIITPVAPLSCSDLLIIPGFAISKNLNNKNANIFIRGETPATDVAINWPENSSTTTSLGSFLLQVSRYNLTELCMSDLE